MNKWSGLRRAVFLGGFMILLCGQVEPARAVSDSTASQTEVRQILSDLEEKMRQIKNMQTKFFQTKQMSLFQHEVKLQGSLAMEKPDRLAWRTESPVRYSIIFEEDKIYQWDEDTQHVQTLSFSNTPVLKMVIEQMQTWFYGSYVALLDQYDIHILSKAPLLLEFIPHKDVLSAAVIESIVIQFQPDQSYIKSLRIEEKNGDQSFLSFTDTVLNAGIEPSVWKVQKRAA